MVVADQVQPATTAPRQMATIAIATIPGFRRSFGGGAIPPSVDVGSRPTVLSSRMDVVMGPSLVLLAQLAQFTSTCASPMEISTARVRPFSRIVPVCPAPAQVMTQSEVAVTVYLSPGLPALDF